MKMKLNCEEISELLSASLDRRLSLAEKLSLRLHWAMCKFCREYKRQMLMIHQALSHWKKTAPQSEDLQLSLKAKQSIKDILQNQVSEG
ncbi:MAG: hypothetical protein COB67_09635 [SAR324 cluster bacterium]|uniref:Putative zinc-finger domain-containing protein n=1 Tax=SAR324 cluster bacterium TaxID=2024889 RepID=A0A2A4SZX6_9DELT|nr:MAG: hypothetical protein COB67_09635 [SAR324 cluster bacterium]